MRSAFLALAMLLILLAPFGEGGREPVVLFVIHTLALLVAACALAAPRSEPARPAFRGRIPLLVAAGLLLGGVSAVRAGYPFAALLGFMDLLAAAGICLAAIAVRAERRDLRLLRAAFVASTAIQAVLAISRYADGGPQAAGASFLNPNHLAAWLGAGFLVCLSEAEARAVARRPARSVLPWAILAAFHFGAAALLASRGLLLGLGAALLAMLLLRARLWRPGLRRAAAGLLVIALGVAGAMIARRFEAVDDPYRYHRARIWSASMELFLEAPILGAGPGMFRHVAPRAAFPIETGPFRFERSFQGAHSGWLTLLVENGLGAACLAAAAVLAAAALVRAPAGAAFERGLGLILVALLAHALVDDLQARPALTLVPALLAGAVLGRAGTRGGARIAPLSLRAGGSLRAVIGAAALTLYWAGVAAPYLGHRVAERARAAGREGIEAMRLAARLAPLHAEYRHDLAMAAINSGPVTPARYAEAYLLLEEARRLKPIDYRYPLLMARLEAIAGGRLFEDPAALAEASRLYREAASLAPFDPRPRLELAHHLADRSPEKALAAARAALDLEPNYLLARLLEARLLLDLGRPGEARAAWRHAEATRISLLGAAPGSGYAAELSRDQPEFRERLKADLAALRAFGSTPPPR